MFRISRLLPLALGLAMMCLTLTVSPFDRGLFTIPLTLAIGFLFARWYLSVPGATIQSAWMKILGRRHWPKSALLPVCLTVLLALLPSLGRGHFPLPGNHDEFSYHLAADTFLLGRLANPTPAGWEHFESFHINVVPSYCSKYQPGMGLMLACGQWIGHPYLGVLLALVLATLALNWMFQQWLPLHWAQWASLLACFPMCGNWSDCYFIGGPLATIAGAILLGLYRSMLYSAVRWFDGMLLALCLVLFFWTRPFEGAIISFCVGLPLLFQLIKQRGVQVLIWPLLPTSLFVLLPALWFQAKLNHASTGSYTRLPYLEHERQYGRTPLFLFQNERTDVPEYRHEQIRLFNQQMIDWYLMQRSPRHWPQVFGFKFGVAWTYFYGLLWLLPLAVLPELLGNNKFRLSVLLWFILLLLLQCVTWFLHHYAAPAFPAWSLAIMFALRTVRLWKWKSLPVGRFLVVMLVTGYCTQILFERTMACVYSKQVWTERRQQLTQQLLANAGSHLVLVEYGQGHNTGQEWVYNSADLTKQPIIWARSMSTEKNLRLIRLYSDRTVWLLKANSEQPEQFPILERYQLK